MEIGKKYYKEYYQLEMQTEHETCSLKKAWIRLSRGETAEEALQKHRNHVRNFNPPFRGENKIFRMVKLKVEIEPVWYLDNNARQDVKTVAVK